MTIALRIALPFFLALSFLLPNHYYPWGSFYLEFSAFVFVVCLLSALAFDNVIIRTPVLLLFFAVLSCVPLMQFEFGSILFHGDAVVASFYIFIFFLTCILGYTVASSENSYSYIRGVAVCLLIIGILSVWISLIQWLGIYNGIWVHGIPSGGRPFGNLGQPNNYSTLIFFSYFSLYFLYEKRLFSKLSFLFVAAFLVLGLALGQSRTAWLVFGSLIFAVLLSFVFFQAYPKRRFFFLLFSAFTLYVLSILLEITSQNLGLHNQLEFRSQVRDVRIDMWQAFLASIIDNPIFGYGWGQVSVAQLSVFELYPQNGMTQYAHNLALDLMIWNGVPLGVLTLLIILMLFFRVFLNSFSRTGFYFFSGLGALMVHSMLEYPYAYAYFLVLAGLFFGAGSVRCNKSQAALALVLKQRIECLGYLFKREFEVGRLVIIPVIVIFFIGLGIIWHEYRLLEDDQRLLRFEAASIGTLRAAEKAPDVAVIDQLKGFLWVARTSSGDLLSGDEKQLVNSVALRYPMPMPLLKRAQIIESELGSEEAVVSLLPIKYIYGEASYESAVSQLIGSQHSEDKD